MIILSFLLIYFLNHFLFIAIINFPPDADCVSIIELWSNTFWILWYVLGPSPLITNEKSFLITLLTRFKLFGLVNYIDCYLSLDQYAINPFFLNERFCYILLYAILLYVLLILKILWICRYNSWCKTGWPGGVSGQIRAPWRSKFKQTVPNCILQKEPISWIEGRDSQKFKRPNYFYIWKIIIQK